MRKSVLMLTILAVSTTGLVPGEGLTATLQAATPPAQAIYQSSGSPNPDEARRVGMNLGVGRYVEVKLISSGTMRGYIRQIADDHFALLLDGMAAPTDIAYGDVRQLRPIPQLVLRPRAPSPVKIEKIVGWVVMGSFLVFAFVECHNKSC